MTVTHDLRASVSNEKETQSRVRHAAWKSRISVGT